MEKEEIVGHVKKFLADKKQMVIATEGNHMWIATVYFACDDDLNLYFLSDPHTLHCQHIAINPGVAVAIADSPQPPESPKRGIQLFGEARQLIDKNENTRAIDLWKKRLEVESDDYSYEGMEKNTIKGRMYVVNPHIIKFFNEELWEEGSEPVINL